MDSVSHMPSGKWAFDEQVTSVFEDMLERSIPNYRIMRELSTDLAVRFIEHDNLSVSSPLVVDIGCSRGDALKEVYNRKGDSLRYLGLEVSDAMLADARDTFRFNESVVIDRCDLAHDTFPVAPSSATVILSILTLMFVPIEYRQRLVSDLYASLKPGGCLILVEKVLGETTNLNRLFVDRYHELKARNGYSQESIDRKRLSLEGVLVPLPLTATTSILREAGFREVDCFWRWCNFAGLVAVR